MGRIYRIRDTQRFVFLLLLVPLLPLGLQFIRPSWTLALLCVGALVVFTGSLLFRRRELEITDEHIRIDRGKWAQLFRQEEIYEIFLIKNCGVQLRLEGRHRHVRIEPDDYEEALRALRSFSWRNAIPLTDKRGPRAASS